MFPLPGGRSLIPSTYASHLLVSLFVAADSSLELTGVSEVEQEDTEFLDSQATLEQESLDATLEEVVKNSRLEADASLIGGGTKESPSFNAKSEQTHFHRPLKYNLGCI